MSLVKNPKSPLWVPGLSFAVLILVSALGSPAYAGPGEDDFKMACAACHTIGGGRLIGPDLAGLAERRSEPWLLKFVLSSQSMINDGDADAVAVFKEYNGMIMPDAPLSERRVSAVLAYIESQASVQTAAAPETAATPATGQAVEQPAEAVAAPSAEEIVLGQNLFQGRVRFAQGGLTCNACHDVQNDAVIGGGILARDLTNVFSTMGREGVRAVIGQAPFPVMQAAYADEPLTTDEISALVAFLQDADAQHAFQQPRDYGIGLLSSGVVGSAIVFGFCGLVWRGRRKASVNQDIYDRQTKSV